MIALRCLPLITVRSTLCVRPARAFALLRLLAVLTACWSCLAGASSQVVHTGEDTRDRRTADAYDVELGEAAIASRWRGLDTNIATAVGVITYELGLGRNPSEGDDIDHESMGVSESRATSGTSRLSVASLLAGPSSRRPSAGNLCQPDGGLDPIFPSIGDCDPACINPNTHCPGGSRKCACDQGFVPFIPLEPHTGIVEPALECLPCGLGGLYRKPGDRQCRYCGMWPNRRVNEDRTACFIKQCVEVTSLAGLYSCDAGIKQARDPSVIDGCGSTNSDCSSTWNQIVETFMVGAASHCNAHDRCYQTCGGSRKGCDRRFRNSMLADCGIVAIGSLIAGGVCATRALVAYQAVRRCGSGPYSDGQRHHCHCCNWEEKP